MVALLFICQGSDLRLLFATTHSIYHRFSHLSSTFFNIFCFFVTVCRYIFQQRLL